jgi:adenylyltransferase/sulfurtransferase
MSLSEDELDRYARHIVLPQFGGTGQQRLKNARVAIVGAGGIGAAVIPSLALAGVGMLTIIDGDAVDLSNLQRQPLYATTDIGGRKAALAQSFVVARNPHVVVNAIDEMLTGKNAAPILGGHDLIVDGTDNFATRLLIADTAVALGIPLLSAAAMQFQGQVALLRRQPCYRCFVGDAFDADDCDNCAELGVLGALTAAVGSFAAILAINALVGIGPLQEGTLHLFDGTTGEWRRIRIPADSACRTCGSAAEKGVV